MGLAIHTSLRVSRALRDATALAKVQAVHAAATRLVRRRQLAAITPVVPAAEMPMVVRWLMIELDEHTSTGIEVPPLAGWCFLVAPGKDCEPAIFGLCRYPATVHDAHGQTHRTRLATGWSFESGCKTQYAGLHGWKHFARCHRAVVDLAQLWKEVGVMVTIVDDGDYWSGRNMRALRAKLATYDRIVAGLAGALKDAADESGGSSVKSPIFAHPDFERIEAEGVARHEASLRAIPGIIARETSRGKS